jgi:hypothetical protein
VVRDFKLIPKSCRRSPAYPYGNEVRATLMRPLIVGFNGGGFTTVSNGSHTGLTQAVCLIQSGGTTCGGSNPVAVNGIPVLPMALGAANFDAWLPEAQRYPCPGGGLCTTAPADRIPTTEGGITTDKYPTYIGIAGDGLRVRRCIIDDTIRPPDLNLKHCNFDINTFCNRIPLASPSTQGAFHCRLNGIITETPRTLYVDTSRGPIYLYVNTAWSSSAPAPIQSASEIKHTFCPSLRTGQVGCLDPAPAASATNPPRAGIFTDLAGTLDLSPNNAIIGFFLWAPKLTVNITNPGGADAFSGALWVNNLSLGPGSQSTYWQDLPAGSAATGTAFPLGGGTNTPFRNLSYDVVARPCNATGAACSRGVTR